VPAVFIFFLKKKGGLLASVVHVQNSYTSKSSQMDVLLLKKKTANARAEIIFDDLIVNQNKTQRTNFLLNLKHQNNPSAPK
jgi:hypothetical protein